MGIKYSKLLSQQWNIRSIPFKIRTRQGCPQSLLLFISVPEVPVSKKERKKEKRCKAYAVATISQKNQILKKYTIWEVPAVWCSGLRIQHCCSCGIGCSWGSDSIPGLGTPTCCECGQKRQKYYLKRHKIYIYVSISIAIQGINLTKGRNIW